MKDKLQYIKDVKDSTGFTHSLMVYGKNDVRLGNKSYKDMKKAIEAVKEIGKR